MVTLTCTDPLNPQTPLHMDCTVSYTRDTDRHPIDTRVLLTNDDRPDLNVEGCAFLHLGNVETGVPPDQFNRKLGRKLAFSRAVEAFVHGNFDGTITPREQRRMKTELWQSFLSQVRVS